MANQMIALQARNPQLPDPSRAAAQYANMMNMASQQRASQLQGERIRQEMEYARAGEARAAETQVLDIRGKQLANEDKELARLYKMGAAILETEDPTAREAAYQNLLGLIEKTSPQLGATMRQVASTFNPNVLQAAMMETEQYFNKKYATPIASLEIREDGTPVSVQVGGLNPEQRPIFDAPETPMAAPRATPTAPQAAPPSGPIPTGKFGETRVIRPESIPLTPDQQDHIRRMQEGLGMTNTPASFTRGGATTPTVGQMSPDMVPAILDSAINTGVMAQIDLDQMLALAPPQARQGIMDVIRDNKIALQADAPSLAASAMSQQQPMAPNPVGRQQSQFADMRGPAPQASLADLGGQPEMRNVMAQTQPRTISKLRLRDPNVSPLPGSSQVPLSRVRGEKTTEAQAAADVNLRMNPVIAAETKKAERAVEKRSEALVAKNETKAAIQSLDKYIEEIDALLRSPDRRFIVGRIEGNLHYLGSLGQNERQAELQAMYDRVKNADTLGSLVEAKQATPTGGSPVGNASNLDVQLIAKSANSLTQTGGVPKFDEDLKKLRREAYRTRQRRIEFYNDRYGDLASEDPKFKLTVRPIANRYISSKDLLKTRTPVPRKASGGFTVVKVED